uniref:Uncharacterized protein n=1 Tax=Sander lucioperca TaxID=283035 RepID=A0A8D0D706_SANLU
LLLHILFLAHYLPSEDHDAVAGVWSRTHPLRPPGCNCQIPDRCRCHPGAGTAERRWSCGVMRMLSWKHNPASDLTPKI